MYVSEHLGAASLAESAFQQWVMIIIVHHGVRWHVFLASDKLAD